MNYPSHQPPLGSEKTLRDLDRSTRGIAFGSSSSSSIPVTPTVWELVRIPLHSLRSRIPGRRRMGRDRDWIVLDDLVGIAIGQGWEWGRGKEKQ